jgi:hypothetical protein
LNHLVCPACKFRLGLARRDGGLVLTYDIGAWQAGCRHLCDAPVLCGHFRPVILAALANGGFVEEPPEEGDGSG